jgi:hypothetical protein
LVPPRGSDGDEAGSGISPTRHAEYSSLKGNRVRRTIKRCCKISRTIYTQYEREYE